MNVCVPVCGCETTNLQPPTTNTSCSTRPPTLHCTCGTLFELLIFLFPPLPWLEDAPQGGQLAVTSYGWSVDSGYQATGPQHPLLVHQLYYSDSDSQRRVESFYRTMKWVVKEWWVGLEGIEEKDRSSEIREREGKESVCVWGYKG